MRANLDRLKDVPVDQLREMLCKANPAIWSEQKRGFRNAPFQLEWYRLMTSARRLCIVAPRDHSKALALDTPVVTPTGHRPLRDVQVGDVVMGRDGPTKVTATSETFTDHDCYRVTLDDGQSFVADAGHRWITNYAWRGERVVTTDDIARDQAARTTQRHVIDCVRIELPDVDLPLDPYVLGVWLGDGTTANGSITTADPEVIEAVELAGYPSTYRYSKTTGTAQTVGFLNLYPILRSMGELGNKHIPDAYLWAGTKQRLALLQGLMDSDGGCSKGQAIFTQARKPELVEAVAHLIWSLGWKPKRYTCRATLNGKDCGEVNGISFYPDEPVFRLERKAVKQRTLAMLPGSDKVKYGVYKRTPRQRRGKAGGRAVTVTPTLSVPVRCLMTESGNYLIGQGVLTHNSEIMTVNNVAWRSCYNPGFWSYVFAATADQAAALKARIDAAVLEADPDLLVNARSTSKMESTYANGARVTAAGVGKAVRGAHPDLICGDDVLEEATTLTEFQRKKMERWWSGAVGPMAHPGTTRVIAGVGKVRFPATQIFLIGTPFHSQDLLMSMRANRLWEFRRYAAEFHPDDLVPGSYAVEMNNG